MQHHSAALLNFAVWARMCGRSTPSVPAPLADGSQQYHQLPPAARVELHEYADRCWRLCIEEAEAAAHDASKVSDQKAALRRRLPHLDDWTAGVLWNQAYRLAMQ